MKTLIYTLILFNLGLQVGCNGKPVNSSQKTETSRIGKVIILNDGVKQTYFIE